MERDVCINKRYDNSNYYYRTAFTIRIEEIGINAEEEPASTRQLAGHDVYKNAAESVALPIACAEVVDG
eukprot:4239106-Alexandrium_andersonii.AAC.1